MSGLSIYHQTLGGTVDVSDNIDAGNWALGGSFRGLTTPNMWYYNGATYALGYELKATNNKVWIVKQIENIVSSFQVNEGTSAPEPQDHPTPLLYINESTGYIYVIQNDFHISFFEVWKSDRPEDISSFTQVSGTFGTSASYLNLLKFSGTNCTFLTRAGGTSSYGNSVLEVDLDSPSGFTQTYIGDSEHSTTDARFYQLGVHRYGTSSYYVGGTHLRDELSLATYMTCLWITTDFDTYENIGQTYSKNVVSTSELTYSEMTTNFDIIGSTAAKSTYYGAFDYLQIDDDVYFINALANVVTLEKYTIGTAAAVATYTFVPLLDMQDSIYWYYNGSKIVITYMLTTLETYIATIDLDLTGFENKKETDIQDAEYWGLPWNMDDIPRGSKYLQIGRSVIGDAGNVPYVITNNNYQ